MTNETQATVGYTLWAVFARPVGGAAPAADAAPPLSDAIDALAATGVTLRGIYDVSGLRADADVMLWLHGADRRAACSAALRELRRTAPLAPAAPRGTRMGVHRDAEFTRDHVPGVPARRCRPRHWLTVYPFVRTYEWYLLPEEERRAMLAEHGRKGREFPQVQREHRRLVRPRRLRVDPGARGRRPVDLVDLMRHLRATEARRHVREEIPFFTGRRSGRRARRGARVSDHRASARSRREPRPRHPAPRARRDPGRVRRASCSPASAGPRARTTSSRSCATSRAAAASPTSGSKRSRTTTATSAASARSTRRTAR